MPSFNFPNFPFPKAESSCPWISRLFQRICYEVGNQEVTEVLGKVLDYFKRCPNELKYLQLSSLREATCMTIHHLVTGFVRGEWELDDLVHDFNNLTISLLSILEISQITFVTQNCKTTYSL